MSKVLPFPVRVRHVPGYIFQHPEEAWAALRADKLGTVYRRATEVYVVTAHGSGTFPAPAWDAAQ